MAEPEPVEEEEEEDEELPAWSLPADAIDKIALPVRWPDRITREWAVGDSTGSGVRVCVLDSGVDGDHPAVGGLAGAWAVTAGADGEITVDEDTEGDQCGHGTACAGIIR